MLSQQMKSNDCFKLEDGGLLLLLLPSNLVTNYNNQYDTMYDPSLVVTPVYTFANNHILSLPLKTALEYCDFELIQPSRLDLIHYYVGDFS